MPDDASLGSIRATRPVRPVRTALADLADDLGEHLIPVGGRAETGTVEVTGLSLSSARVLPGDLYAALAGERTHGATYAAEALAGGAVAVLTDAAGARLLESGPGLTAPLLVVDDPRSVLGGLAARIYGEPARELRLMGATGTQGKTTTTRLLEAGLQAAGVRAGVVGTNGTRIAGQEVRTALTTPEAPDLHALFARMREEGVVGCALEVSSHALVKGRVDGVVLDVAAFLNLGHDHLDFHHTMADYFAAKASLFTPRRARRGLTNLDDEHGRLLLERAGIPMRTFAVDAADDADWRAVDVELRPEGSSFTVLGPGGLRFAAGVPLTGAFNVSNALGAIALAGEAGFDAAAVARGIAATGGVPGRLERVDAGQDFLAVVDYAHKPEAVTAALEALRPLTAGRLVLVIGAGGDRDTAKRPMMGRIGAGLADELVVTDDNPRTEDPAAIRAAVLAGVGPAPRAVVHEVGDRRTAIRRAIAEARTGDTVLVAGKGHETGQEVAGVVHPFDDRDEVHAALAHRLADAPTAGDRP